MTARFQHPDYEVLRALGRGGAGTVFLCKHRLLGRPEVVKVPAPEVLRRPGMRERFLQEVQAAASLQHPNVVTAFGVVTTRDGLALTMEYVDGPDLHQLVSAKGQLSVDRACRYAIQVCRGLAAADARGLVHRDIKPANLIRATVDGAGVIKILDFGLAQVRSAEADSRLTSTGDVLGTPDFMPPEQARDPGSADIRSDLYALGGTLYFLLTGRTPFPRPGLLATLDAHRYDAPPDLTHARPDVPPALAAVVTRMLAKKPGERFQTPAEVAQALAIGVAGPNTGERPALARPAPPPPPVSKRVPLPARTAYMDAAAFEQATKPKPPRRATVKAKDAPPEWLLPAVLGGAGLLALAALIGFVLVQAGRPDAAETATARPEPPGLEAPRQPDGQRPGGGGPSPVPGVVPPPVDGKLPDGWDGFTKLFAGSRTGWREAGQPGNWAVQPDGTLVGRGSGQSLLVYDPANYVNAHIRARVRLATPGAVGGLCVRCQADGTAGGYTAYATADEADEAKTGSLKCGDLVAARHVVSHVRPREWFVLDVIARGDRVEVRVNDRPTAQYTDPARRYGRGMVALQAASNAAVEFSHIAVRELTAPSPSPADADPPPLTANRQGLRGYTFRYDPHGPEGVSQECDLIAREGVHRRGDEPFADHLRAGDVVRRHEWSLRLPEDVPPQGYRLFIFRQGKNTVPVLLTSQQAAELPRDCWPATLQVNVGGKESVVTQIRKKGT